MIRDGMGMHVIARSQADGGVGGMEYLLHVGGRKCSDRLVLIFVPQR